MWNVFNGNATKRARTFAISIIEGFNVVVLLHSIGCGVRILAGSCSPLEHALPKLLIEYSTRIRPWMMVLKSKNLRCWQRHVISFG
jgi:hypothetical protein